ncbi:Adhesion G protein-coupled receptor A3 [Varanus komodoensis]|nr:Adhesion G protein-coupled receptor A3 [Varanus komodoensis]
MDQEDSPVVVTCNICAMFVFLSEVNVDCTCHKCKLGALLEEKDKTEGQPAPEEMEDIPCSTEQEAKAQPSSGNDTKACRNKKRREIVVGDSLLHGMETQVCQNDPWTRQACCLPGEQISDITERLPRLIQPTDMYPFPLTHVGTNDTAKQSLKKSQQALKL